MSETHVPVLIDEVSKLAAGCSRIVDCTVGDGGHAMRLIEIGSALLAIDRDSQAIATARSRMLRSADVTWLNSRFADPQALCAVREFQPDFILFDLGVSSRQLDTDSRGFSFRRQVSLDMRMAPSDGPSGEDLLNTLDASELQRMFRDYADEPRAKRLAATIVRRRERTPFRTSDDLVNAIREALGARSGPSDFARVFQAVRIEVNGEIRQLTDALPECLDALVGGGKIAVISYHSAEDRVVKQMFREWAAACVCPPHALLCSCRGKPLGERIYKKPVQPGEPETTVNPRARSAKLRAFRKHDAA